MTAKGVTLWMRPCPGGCGFSAFAAGASDGGCKSVELCIAAGVDHYNTY